MINDAYIGTSPYQNIYMGNNLIWSRKPPIPQGYIAKWDMNGNLLDDSPNKNNANTSYHSFVPGRKSNTQSVRLSNVAISPTIPINLTSYATKEFSISFWVYYRPSGSTYILHMPVTGLGVLTFSEWSSGFLMMYEASKVSDSMNVHFPKNYWNHMVVTINTAKPKASEVTVYMNNVKHVGLNTSDGAVNLGSIDVFLGGINKTPSNQTVPADFQDVRIYHRELTEAEVELLYTE